MKKILLILAIISCVCIAFSTLFGIEYKPMTPSRFLRLLGDSKISFENSIATIQEMQGFINRDDTFESFDKFNSGDSDDEKGFLKQILNTLTAFFNYTVDFFVMVGYTIKLILLFVFDALQSIVDILSLIFKLVGLSPTT